MIASTANRRRLAATVLKKLPAETADPGLGQDGDDRLFLLLGREDRAAHEALEVVALGNQGAEPVEVGLHRIDDTGVTRQLEQSRRVASCHSGYVGLGHSASLGTFRKGAPAAMARPRPPDWKGSNSRPDMEFPPPAHEVGGSLTRLFACCNTRT